MRWRSSPAAARTRTGRSASRPGTDDTRMTNAAPADAAQRRAVKPVVVYAVDHVPAYDRALFELARQAMTKLGEVIVPPREARTFEVPAGHFFRIVSIEGSQVGDLNLWNAHDLSE